MDFQNAKAQFTENRNLFGFDPQNQTEKYNFYNGLVNIASGLVSLESRIYSIEQKLNEIERKIK